MGNAGGPHGPIRTGIVPDGNRALWRTVLLSGLILASLARCSDETPEGASIPSQPSPESSVATTPLTRIMPLGDSITQADSEHDSYRRSLWRTLSGAGFEVDFVGSHRVHHRGPAPSDDFDQDHEGHWGIRVDEVNRDLERWVRSARPDVLLVHLGSNDVFQDQDNASTAVELEESIRIARRVNPEIIVLLARIIPTDAPSVNRDIEDLNSRIEALAMRVDSPASPVRLVDQARGFDARVMTYDGVHPNREGEQRMAMRWFEVLTDTLPSSPSTTSGVAR